MSTANIEWMSQRMAEIAVQGRQRGERRQTTHLPFNGTLSSDEMRLMNQQAFKSHVPSWEQGVAKQTVKKGRKK